MGVELLMVHCSPELVSSKPCSRVTVGGTKPGMVCEVPAVSRNRESVRPCRMMSARTWTRGCWPMIRKTWDSRNSDTTLLTLGRLFSHTNTNRLGCESESKYLGYIIELKVTSTSDTDGHRKNPPRHTSIYNPFKYWIFPLILTLPFGCLGMIILAYYFSPS